MEQLKLCVDYCCLNKEVDIVSRGVVLPCLEMIWELKRIGWNKCRVLDLAADVANPVLVFPEFTWLFVLPSYTI